MRGGGPADLGQPTPRVPGAMAVTAAASPVLQLLDWVQAPRLWQLYAVRAVLVRRAMAWGWGGSAGDGLM